MVIFVAALIAEPLPLSASAVTSAVPLMVTEPPVECIAGVFRASVEAYTTPLSMTMLPLALMAGSVIALRVSVLSVALVMVTPPVPVLIILSALALLPVTFTTTGASEAKRISPGIAPPVRVSVLSVAFQSQPGPPVLPVSPIGFPPIVALLVGSLVTVTVTGSDTIEAFAVDVANTVSDVALSLEATVSTLDDIDVPAPPPRTDHVTPCGGLFPPVTFTVVNVCVVPLCTEALAGETVTPVTEKTLKITFKDRCVMSGPPDTVMVAVYVSAIRPNTGATVKLALPSAGMSGIVAGMPPTALFSVKSDAFQPSSATVSGPVGWLPVLCIVTVCAGIGL